MQPITKAAISVFMLLSLAPIVAVSALVFGDPERWSESQHPLAILVMAFFGLFTTPLWPTYIPALVLTPLIMHKVSQKRLFKKVPFALLLIIALAVGAVAGVFVMFPLILMERADSSGHPANWAMAGAVSGALSLVMITILYRMGGNANAKW